MGKPTYLPTSETPVGLLARWKKRREWKAFTKHTLKFVGKEMSAQQDITIKRITDEMMRLDLPLTNDVILMNIISKLKDESPNMNTLRQNYAILKRDMAEFFTHMDLGLAM